MLGKNVFALTSTIHICRGQNTLFLFVRNEHYIPYSCELFVLSIQSRDKWFKEDVSSMINLCTMILCAPMAMSGTERSHHWMQADKGDGFIYVSIVVHMHTAVTTSLLQNHFICEIMQLLELGCVFWQRKTEQLKMHRTVWFNHRVFIYGSM